MDDNTRQVVRSEQEVETAPPQQEVVSQTTSTTSADRTTQAYVAPTAMNNSTMRTTTTSASPAPSDRVVSRNVAEQVVDPAADKAAAVDWVSRLVWFVVGVMVVLLLIRFVLLLAGANEAAGFAQLIYGLTGWMVAPFKGLFGSNWTYPGTAGTGLFEPESLVAALVYILIGWGITSLSRLLLGTNRTRGTVYSDTHRETRL